MVGLAFLVMVGIAVRVAVAWQERNEVWGVFDDPRQHYTDEDGNPL